MKKHQILLVVRHPVGGIRTFFRYFYRSLDRDRYHFTLVAPALAETSVLLDDLREVDLDYVAADRNATNMDLLKLVTGVILGRELAVTGLRAMAGAEGIVVPASNLGKWKTGFQLAALTALLVHHPFLGLPSHELGLVLLIVATALTVWSGWEYFSAYLGDRSPRP